MKNESLLDSNESLNSSLDESRYSNLIPLDYKDDIANLILMGFDKKIIKKIYAFLHPDSLEQAIIYMTEENGFYLHNFYQNTKHKNLNTCYICGEPRNKHMDYLPENFIEEENNNNNIINSINNNNNIIINDIDIDINNNNNNIINTPGPKIELKKKVLVACIICGDEVDKSEMKKYPKCGHEYCFHCWDHYLRGKINESNVRGIKCMDYNCKEIIDEKFIYSFIENDKVLLEKYKKFKLKLEILNDSNKKFCPHPNCDSYGQKEKNNKFIKCKNGHKFCFVCLKDWHDGKKCDVDDEEGFQIWKKNKIIKQCPKCKMYTEKNEGCNHMTCVECKYQWCWLCCGEYKTGHFTTGKCAGLQFFKPKNEEEIKGVLNNPDSIARGTYRRQNFINNRPIVNNNYNNFNNNRRYIPPPQPRIDHSRNVFRYKPATGLIPFGYYDTYNDIDENNPLRLMGNNITFCQRIFYVLLYLFLTPFFFVIAQHNRYLDELEDNWESFLGFLFILFRILGVFILYIIYFIPYFYFQIIISTAGLLYWPLIEKIKIIWYLKVFYNLGKKKI